VQTPTVKTISRDPENQSYTPPVIVYEASLEVRAGSPLGLPDLTDSVDPS
jgi:hypothetical protein